jgi:Uma2 family endonuclease
MTVTEFLAWDAPGSGSWQLVDGEPVAMAPASRTHGALQLELGRLIGNHLVASGSPCTVIAAPGIIPRVRASENFRIPELAVTCTQYETEEYDVSDPVLIVEVLSPSNRAETWQNCGHTRPSPACGKSSFSGAPRSGRNCCVVGVTETGPPRRQ